MDFVMGLPRRKQRFDNVFVVVDRFSKMVHFVPSKSTNDASHIAHLFFEEIVRNHGLPKTFFLDRDVKFQGYFWHTFHKKLGTNITYSSAYHPQIDGQLEKVNRSLGNLFRCLTKKYNQSWDVILPQEEFSFNDSLNISTGKKPFQIVYGMHPRGPLDLKDLPIGFKVSS